MIQSGDKFIPAEYVDIFKIYGVNLLGFLTEMNARVSIFFKFCWLFKFIEWEYRAMVNVPGIVCF